MGTWRSSYPKVTGARLNCTNARMIIQSTQVYFHINRRNTEEKPNARSKDKFAMAMLHCLPFKTDMTYFDTICPSSLEESLLPKI